MNKENIGRRFC